MAGYMSCTTYSAEYEGWDAIPSSAQQKIREAHYAREATEAELLHVQQQQEQEQQEAAASARSDIPASGLLHGADTREESSAAHARDEPRLTSGGQDLAHQLARAMTLGANAGTLAYDSLKPRDGKIGAGDDEQTKAQGFSSMMIAVGGQHGTLSVLEQEKAVKVGLGTC